MSRQSKIGLTLLIVGTLAFGANMLAYYALSDSWGGPNFLGGCIQLLSLAVVLAGVVFMLGGVPRSKPDR